MNKHTSPGMLAARRRRMCNEYANVLLQHMHMLVTHPIRPPLNMSHYSYFEHFKKVAATIVSIIQLK